jgi:hypothetical protein
MQILEQFKVQDTQIGINTRFTILCESEATTGPDSHSIRNLFSGPGSLALRLSSGMSAQACSA